MVMIPVRPVVVSTQPCASRRAGLAPMSLLPTPCGPAKSQAYLATTLSWIGDPGAEGQARQVLARLESATDGPPRPRRADSLEIGNFFDPQSVYLL